MPNMRCVQSGGCVTPSDDHYFTDNGLINHPVVEVTWDNAKTYCEWAGSRLPTEAEWEKAARGTDGRTYPWCEGIDCDKANYKGCVDRTTEVGIYDNGKSEYGLYEMAGNVLEWVADWYGGWYYASSPASNPSGPEDGTWRVLRGGSYHSDEGGLRTFDRDLNDPSNILNDIGFRCARSAAP